MVQSKSASLLLLLLYSNCLITVTSSQVSSNDDVQDRPFDKGLDAETEEGDPVKHFRKVFPFLNESDVPDNSIRFVRYPSGNFTGQTDSNGFKDGWGEILWSNGSLYGPSNIFYYSSGDKYFGQWKNDLQEGIGTLYSQTGVYVGQWSGGIQSGFGKSFFNNGNKYEGEYKDGFKHGRGTFTVQFNGDVYTGDFENGMRSGQGIESFGQTGERYVGVYANDTRNGIGTAYYADGSTKYFGDWRNGSPDGNGTFFLPERGLKFVGEFTQGQPSGQGTIYNAAGDVLQPYGPWGGSGTGNIQSLPIPGNGNSFLQNLDFGSNKYTNLVRMIGNWISGFVES